MPTNVDHLTEDEPIKGQKWVCISFVSPEGVMNCSVRGVKIRGVFDERQEAEAHAKKLQEIDPLFDIFVGEVGKWLAWDPDPETAVDQVHQNEKLNELVHQHKENQEKAKVAEKQRQQSMLEKAAQEQKAQRPHADTVKNRLRKKLEERNKPVIEEIVDEASDTAATTTSVTDRLKRINQLHNQLNL